MPDKVPAWKQVVIDGDTLEKRREQRKEQLLRYAETMSEESKRGVLGYVTQWTKEKGVQGVRTADSLMTQEQRQRGQGIKNIAAVAPDDAFQLDPIVKRSPQERIESMAQRLMKADPAQNEQILKEIGEEYWKAGAPITHEQLRAIAAHFLNRAERKSATQ